MSYHSSRSKQPVPTSRHRSSSASRTPTTSYSSRPRSMGFYGSNYSSPYSSSSMSSSPYSSLSAYGSNYGSSYQSPYFPNGYRGSTGSGYASLTIPAKGLSNINVLTPNYSKSYENNRDSYTKGDAARRARRDLARNNSYGERALSRSRGSLASSNMGSRSISLTSLNSEGYISGSEGRRSRVSSTADIRNENGEIDYKKLYEEQLTENERLQDLLKKSNEELRDTKQTLEKINVVTSKNSLSELEKRERRAMERKLSEMEEELKQLQKLKAENERLKADNRSLTRVINKLTNSPKK